MLPQRDDGLFPCPVRGHIPKWMEERDKPFYSTAWYEDNGLASADICPCCDFQPVCDDSTLDGTVTGTWSLWRKQWLSRWLNVEKVWIDTFGGYMQAVDAIRQLKNAGIFIDEINAESKDSLRKVIEEL